MPGRALVVVAPRLSPHPDLLLTPSSPLPPPHPSRCDDNRDAHPWWWAFFYLWLHSVGAIIEEVATFYRTVFNGLELGKQWRNLISTVAELAEESIHTGVSGIIHVRARPLGLWARSPPPPHAGYRSVRNSGR